MLKGKLSNGFEYEIDERMGRDARFLEKLRRATKIERKIEKDGETPELNAEYAEALMDIIDRLFGEGQKERLYDFIEDDCGIVDYTIVTLCANEVIMKLQEDNSEVKNS